MKYQIRRAIEKIAGQITIAAPFVRIIGRRCLPALLIFNCLTSAISAQTSGGYQLTSSVIAAGGGSDSTGGGYSLSGTIGQTDAGETDLMGGNFLFRGGFWAFETLAPTAANASISGRVTTANGNGIRGAQITLFASDGTVRVTQTASFGYFRFENVEVGQICILEILSKRFVFDQPTRVLKVSENITDADFIARDK